MATILIEGEGSWAPAKPSQIMLRSGVYETDDPVLIQQALDCGLTWVEVRFTPDEERARLDAPASTQPEPPPVRQIIDATNPGRPDPQTGGAMTTADLKPVASDFLCPLCPEKKITSKAALMSHRRGKHPDVEPATGEPKNQAPAPTPGPVVPPQEPVGALNPETLEPDPAGQVQANPTVPPTAPIPPPE